MAKFHNHYDYIIAGAGCAGLSLAYRLSISPLSHKKILLVDPFPKDTNDRTWCFWERTAGLFEPVVYKSWSGFTINHPNGTIDQSLHPYHYKMIRGVDFYQYIKDHLSNFSNIHWLQGKVVELNQLQSQAGLQAITLEGENHHFSADYVFNSAIKPEWKGNKASRQWLFQHFMGKVISSRYAVFSTEVVTLMDFNIQQINGETCFIYTLPFSPYEALIEYTVFSVKKWSYEDYNYHLMDYIHNRLNLHSQDISVTEEEMGSIPMTDYPFQSQPYPNIINIGIMGGQAKPSTGYTFKNIQKQTQSIVYGLLANKSLSKSSLKRYKLYDSILLNVLGLNRMEGRDVFFTLFKKHPPERIFRYLDEESSVWQEVQIAVKMPWKKFLKAFFQVLFRSKPGVHLPLKVDEDEQYHHLQK